MNLIDTIETIKGGNGKRSRALTCGLACAALIATLPAVAGTSTFEVLDNKGDVHFNQLLGINNSRILVGYFGDGNEVANNGYVLLPMNHYSVENFTNLPMGDSATQTQAIGISNNTQAPLVVGFYTDASTGFTHGFLDINGTQVTLDDPLGGPSHVTTPAQNLLSVNQTLDATGFWTDNSGHLHGFVVGFTNAGAVRGYAEISPSLFPGAVSTQVSTINDDRDLCGFWTDKNGVSHGFFGQIYEAYTTFDVVINGVKAASTQAFGCNNNGDIVGQFADSSGNLHGFIYNFGNFTQFDAPGSSQVPELGVQGTLINGINDLGDIVGFFSDGKSAVNGFVQYASE